jgi:hypothetical protein
MDLFIDSNILNEALGNVKDTSSMNSNSTKFIDFLNKLEGWKTKCKNLHWASHKKNIHTYLDDFLEVLQEYQDGLAEEEMGIYGRMLPNVIVGISSMATNAKEFIQEIKTATLIFYEGLPQDAVHAGIRSECETFIHNINKYVYLFSLTDQEFKGGE